ncbi:MAG TPA: hypothetical protein ENI87_01760 [bacterium]|nr:hypothetical protein [bacterium]
MQSKIDRTFAIDCGDYWFFGWHATKDSSANTFIGATLYRGGSDTSDFIVGGAQLYAEHIPPHIAMQADTAAVSRGADLITIDADMLREATVDLQLDEALAEGQGDILANGAAPVLTLNSDRSVTVSDPAGVGAPLTGDRPLTVGSRGAWAIEKTGMRHAVGGQLGTPLSGSLSPEAGTDLYLGGRSDGTNMLGAPIARLGIWRQAWNDEKLKDRTA